jgi:3-methylfumaryl-CoA hydratase
VTRTADATVSGTDEWAPHTVTSVETVDAGRVAALTALFDSGAPLVGHGDVLPPLWHWAAMPQWPASSALGADGHPRRGGFLPPLDLPKRMFAGGHVTLHGDLHVGAEVVREATVSSVEAKSGLSGPFALVQVKILLRDCDGAVLVDERQDLVYRADTPPRSRTADPSAAADKAPGAAPLRPRVGGWDLVTDPTLLMRFSAATANPHRIHYDWPYATQVEGYPGLVVHGPLSTLLLAEAVRLTVTNRRVRSVRHRNVAPLFCGQAARLDICTDTDPAEATLRGDAGGLLATLHADLAPFPEAHSLKGKTHA